MARLWRYTPLIALAVAVALLVIGVLIVYSAERGYRVQEGDELQMEARILASTVVAALTFDDRAAAKAYVGALQANPEIEAAAIYDHTGVLFADYRRGDRTDVPARAPSLARLETQTDIAATELVTQGQTELGSVYVRAALEPLSHRIQRYAAIGLLVVMALLLAAVLSVAQATSSRANQALAAANARLQAEIAEREHAEEALRQAQKMEAIGQLTGGVAHDFNNVLQVILGNLGTVQHRLRRDGEIQAHLLSRRVDSAVRAGERAAVLTAQLLAFSRRQPLQPKQIDVNRLLSGMSDILHRTLGEGIDVETVLGARLWGTLADANQLESAILNLAVNARDAMPGGGKLTIETANTYLDEAYAASEADLHSGQYVVIAVTDTGAGMGPEIIAKAFDPFFTTKEIGQGTGLGLSQVYGFIKQSGGHAKIYSEPGAGTTIKLYLPRVSEGEEEDAAGAGDLPTPRGDREVILVVEDEPDVRRFVVDLLRELDYEVLDAGDGPAALQMLDRRADVNLLSTDVGLPGGFNGRQLADEARRRWPALKVLYATGYARNAIVHQGRLDPGVELITKPFTQTALAARIRQMLDTPARPNGV